MENAIVLQGIEGKMKVRLRWGQRGLYRYGNAGATLLDYRA